MPALHPSSGFIEPVFEAQGAFRIVMMALARPGVISQFHSALVPPEPLTRELAAIALALCDHETPIWLDASLGSNGAVCDFLRFHTGAVVVPVAGDATFAFVTEARALPQLSEFAQGTDEYPDRSTTIVMAVDRIEAGLDLVLRGPGIAEEATLAIDPLPEGFVGQFQENRARFPRGVDIIFTTKGKVAALPRSTNVEKV